MGELDRAVLGWENVGFHELYCLPSYEPVLS